MPGETIVIIGGDAAGMSAASQAKRRRPDLTIVAFERGPHTSYSACGIPYYVGGLVASAQDLIARTPEEFHRRGIDARVMHEVEAIDLTSRTVRVQRLTDGARLEESFDQLVIATGAVPVRPNLPGAEAEGVHSLGILRDGIAVRAAVDAEKPRRAVIVGGGYIGIEMAEAFRLRGIEVALLEQGDEVMGTLDPDMGRLISDALRDGGVALHLGERAEAFITRDGRVVAVETSQRSLPADLVVLAIGVRPNSALAEDAGLAIGQTGGILVNDRMQTGVDGIWAVGDCAETFHLVSRQAFHVALGTVANKQGRVCGINLGGGYARFPGVLGTAVTKFCGLEIGRTGLQESEAQALGFQYAVGKIVSTTTAGYYPDAAEITVKVLAEKRTARLLGGQIVGGPGAAKRIDVLATAIAAGMTADEFEYLDLSYAPPFSPVWDPVLIAARKAAAGA